MPKPSVDIVLPVYNEERDLPRSVAVLRHFLAEHLPNLWRIVIADNASVDATPQVAQGLAEQYPDVANLRLEQKGRGLALRRAWLDSPADLVCYMDVDLSTDLEALLSLLQALEEGYDLAIGSRLMSGARVTGRSVKREVMSRSYVRLIKALFLARFSDAQCGFKALTRQAAHALLPHVVDTQFFFDTELLLIAEKRGFRIKEVPVAWADDPDSRVDILRTVRQDVAGLMRLRLGGLPRVSPPAR